MKSTMLPLPAAFPLFSTLFEWSWLICAGYFTSSVPVRQLVGSEFFAKKQLHRGSDKSNVRVTEGVVGRVMSARFAQ